MSQNAKTNPAAIKPLEKETPNQPWPMDAAADRLMDDVFADVDHMLDSKGELPTQPAEPEYISLKQIAVPRIVMPPTPTSPDKEAETSAKTEKSPKSRRFEKLLLLAACASLGITLLLWLAGQGKLNWLLGIEPTTTPSAQEEAAAQAHAADSQFIDYMQRSLELIEQKAEDRKAATVAEAPPSANPPLPVPFPGSLPPEASRPLPVLERIYIPIYPRTPVPNPPAASAVKPAPQAAAPTAPPANSAPKPTPQATAARPTAPAPTARPTPTAARPAVPAPTVQPTPTAARPTAPAPTARPTPTAARPAAPAPTPQATAARPTTPAPTVQPTPTAARPTTPAPTARPTPTAVRPAAPTPTARPTATVTQPVAPPAVPVAQPTLRPQPAPQASAPQPVNRHILRGLLNSEDKSKNAALFEVNGVTRRIYIGETISSSGWTLVEVNNNEAIIRRNGEVRSIFLEQEF